MSLSARGVEVISSIPRQLTSFFHHVPIPDEAFFQTVLRHDAGLSFALITTDTYATPKGSPILMYSHSTTWTAWSLRARISAENSTTRSTPRCSTAWTC